MGLEHEIIEHLSDFDEVKELIKPLRTETELDRKILFLGEFIR